MAPARAEHRNQGSSKGIWAPPKESVFLQRNQGSSKGIRAPQHIQGFFLPRVLSQAFPSCRIPAFAERAHSCPRSCCRAPTACLHGQQSWRGRKINPQAPEAALGARDQWQGPSRGTQGDNPGELCCVTSPRCLLGPLCLSGSDLCKGAKGKQGEELLLSAPEGLQIQLVLHKGEDKTGSSLGRAHPEGLRRCRRGRAKKATTNSALK